MIPGDPNVQIVQTVAAALGELRDELVLVGGCAASLLIDAPAATPPRVTYDVDLITEVAALSDYHSLERRFSRLGFARDQSSGAPICRWTLGPIKVDLMPTSEAVLGFSNRWYAEAVASALRTRLPDGTAINLISAPAFLATKFEAFQTRGAGDFMGSHDFEDIINVLEGRLSIVDDIRAATSTLKDYLHAQISRFALSAEFMNILPGLVAYDELHGQRVAAVRQTIASITLLPRTS